MELTSDQITQIIIAIIAGGGISALLKFIQDRRKDPFTRAQAHQQAESERIKEARAGEAAARTAEAEARAREVAATQKVTEVWEAFAAFQRNANEEATKTRNMAEEALANSRRADRKLDRFIQWFHNEIVGDWDNVRQSPTPPDLPSDLNTGPMPRVNATEGTP